MGVINRVHGHTANRRTLAHMALATRFTQIGVQVVRIRHGADSGHAVLMHHAQLAAHQANLSVTCVTTHQLSIGAGGAGHLAALKRLELNIVDDGADRHVLQRHRIARLHVNAITREDSVASRQTLRSQDVGQLAIFVLDQCDEGGAVRVVFQTLDRRRDIKLATFEVDDAIELLGAAAATTRRDATGVVTTARFMQTLDERLFGATRMQPGLVHQHECAAARRGRLESLQSHGSLSSARAYRPVLTSMEWPSSRVTTAFLTSSRLPAMPRKRLVLPF
mmetsp:Transcript_45533/g.60402  ORF Transcript_45533/g.60402 Transcript_45533/m.60402 type:complete len:278 (-) Transcript_45533:132-965(-)